MTCSPSIRKLSKLSTLFNASTTPFLEGSLEANTQQSRERNFLHTVDEIQSLQVDIRFSKKKKFLRAQVKVKLDSVHTRVGNWV